MYFVCIEHERDHRVLVLVQVNDDAELAAIAQDVAHILLCLLVCADTEKCAPDCTAPINDLRADDLQDRLLLGTQAVACHCGFGGDVIALRGPPAG